MRTTPRLTRLPQRLPRPVTNAPGYADLQPYLEAFPDFLRAQGAAWVTVGAQNGRVTQWLEWLKSTGRTVTADTLRRYLEELQKGGTPVTTIRARFAAVARFRDFVERMGGPTMADPQFIRLPDYPRYAKGERKRERITYRSETQAVVLALYRDFLTGKGYRPGTVRTFGNELLQFFRWLDENPGPLDRLTLDGYREHLLFRQVPPTRERVVVSALSLFCEMAEAQGKVKRAPDVRAIWGVTPRGSTRQVAV